MTTKLCRDCQFYYLPGDAMAIGSPRFWAECQHSAARRETGPDLVTGAPAVARQRSCDEMRVASLCGPDGKLFEPKDGAVGFVAD